MADRLEMLDSYEASVFSLWREHCCNKPTDHPAHAGFRRIRYRWWIGCFGNREESPSPMLRTFAAMLRAIRVPVSQEAGRSPIRQEVDCNRCNRLGDVA